VQHVLALVDVLDEALHPAGVSEVSSLPLRWSTSWIFTRCEERQLGAAAWPGCRMVLDDAEGRGARQEMNFRAAALRLSVTLSGPTATPPLNSMKWLWPSRRMVSPQPVVRGR